MATRNRRSCTGNDMTLCYYCLRDDETSCPAVTAFRGTPVCEVHVDCAWAEVLATMGLHPRDVTA